MLFGSVEVGIPEPPEIPPGEAVGFPTIRSLIVTCVVGGERGVIRQEGLDLLEFGGRRLLIPRELECLHTHLQQIYHELGKIGTVTADRR